MKTWIRRVTGVAGTMVLISVLVVGCGGDDDATVCDDIGVANAFVRLPGGENTALYVDLTNDGDVDTALVGATTDIAGMVELHEVGADDEGVMQMRPVDGQRIALPSGATVSLEPGGLHVMAMGLTDTLTVGDEVGFTLTFEDGCTIELTAPVRAVDTDMGDDMGHDG